MGTLWFCLVALMIAVYVLLDGFDLGAGAIHLFVARTDEERRQVLASVGPVWDGNEVWLIAAGGTLYFAFPALYASAFSGFYLPLMIVLWLLILRGASIEFRNHIKSAVWDPLWDFLFCTSSLLLAVFFGAALGNVVRGVPLDASGYFFEPLWTNFRLGYVDECSLRRIPDGLAGTESGVFLDGSDGKSRRLWFEDRAGLVDHRNYSGNGIFHLRVSLLCGQSCGRQRFARLRRLKLLLHGTACDGAIDAAM